MASPSHLSPANQPFPFHPSVKAYIGSWGGCPVVVDLPELLCPAPADSCRRRKHGVLTDLTHLWVKTSVGRDAVVLPLALPPLARLELLKFRAGVCCVWFTLNLWRLEQKWPRELQIWKGPVEALMRDLSPFVAEKIATFKAIHSSTEMCPITSIPMSVWQPSGYSSRYWLNVYHLYFYHWTFFFLDFSNDNCSVIFCNKYI